MQIDIRDLAGGPLIIKKTLQPVALELDEPSAKASQPIEVDLVVDQDEDEITVTGSAKTELSVLCGRCSEYIPWPIEVTGIDHHIPLADLEGIDLTPLIREDILLALPVVATCRLDASFRCPISGTVYPPDTKPPASLVAEDAWQALDKLKLKE